MTMKARTWRVSVLATALGSLLAFGSMTRADEIPEEYRETVRKGLEYLKKTQSKDGHWAAQGEQHPVAMTGLATIALMAEGSTIRQGKYANEIRRAVDWMMDRCQRGQRDGLIGDTNNPIEAGRYMYGHGFALTALALAYGEEEDRDRQERLKDILTRAVKYVGNAQSTQGGWFYTSAKDGHDQDEGSVTVTQMQALRACKNAGIPVPKAIMKKGYDYLKNSTTPRGGVVYSLGRGGMGAPAGGERPALTAAAIACLFSAGEYKDELIKKWFKYSQTAIPIGRGGGVRMGHDEYTHFYWAQACYFLGEDGWEKLFPNSPANEKVTWSAYRHDMFDMLKRTQTGDGSWPSGGGFSVGPVYSTAIYCTILQLDLGTLPVFQR
jgi:hypothetical protein